jgi:hypothetical protein
MFGVTLIPGTTRPVAHHASNETAGWLVVKEFVFVLWPSCTAAYQLEHRDTDLLPLHAPFVKDNAATDDHSSTHSFIPCAIVLGVKTTNC